MFQCADPINQAWASLSGKDLFANDGRFIFYYERFENHMKAKAFAEKQRESAERAQTEMVESGVLVQSVEFVLDTVDLVINCRAALAWASVFAFFISNTLARERFQCTQAQLEELTEKLSAMTEKTPEELIENRQGILAHSGAVHKVWESGWSGREVQLNQGV